VILTGRNPDRLKEAATELGALSTATFDANDLAALGAFFDHLEWRAGHTSTWDPMRTTRSRGRQKCSAASAVVWEVAMKSLRSARA
jgi:hypothetical protein